MCLHYLFKRNKLLKSGFTVTEYQFVIARLRHLYSIASIPLPDFPIWLRKFHSPCKLQTLLKDCFYICSLTCFLPQPTTYHSILHIVCLWRENPWQVLLPCWCPPKWRTAVAVTAPRSPRLLPGSTRRHSLASIPSSAWAVPRTTGNVSTNPGVSGLKIQLSEHLHTKHEWGQKWETPPPPSNESYAQSWMAQRGDIFRSWRDGAGRWWRREEVGCECVDCCLLLLLKQSPSPLPWEPEDRAMQPADACFPGMWSWCELPWQFLHMRSVFFGPFYVRNKVCYIQHWNSVYPYRLPKSEVSAPMTLTSMLPTVVAGDPSCCWPAVAVWAGPWA